MQEDAPTTAVTNSKPVFRKSTRSLSRLQARRRAELEVELASRIGMNQVVVDDFDVAPAKLLGAIDEAVLAPSALMILLPVRHTIMWFALPAAITDIAYQNKAVIYDPVVQGIGRDPGHHRVRPHAPRLSRRHHLRSPHLGFGLDPSTRPHDRARWRHLARWRAGAASPCQCACSRLFRRLFLTLLRAAHEAGRLQFFGGHAALADTRPFAAYLAPLRRTEWIVYAKRPFGAPRPCGRICRAIPTASPSPTAG